MSDKFKIVLCSLFLCTLVACQKNVSLDTRDYGAAPTHLSVPLSAQTKKCLKEYHVSYETLAAQFALFQTALQNDHSSDALVLVKFPLRVNLIKNNQHVSNSIESTTQFSKFWPQLFNSPAKQKILAAHGEDSNQMICNDLGIGFANGLVWFYGDSKAQIYVINNIA